MNREGKAIVDLNSPEYYISSKSSSWKIMIGVPLGKVFTKIFPSIVLHPGFLPRSIATRCRLLFVMFM